MRIMSAEHLEKGARLYTNLLAEACEILAASRESMKEHGKPGSIEQLCFAQMETVLRAADHADDVAVIGAMAAHLVDMTESSAAAYEVLDVDRHTNPKAKNMAMLAGALYVAPIAAQLFAGMSGGEYELRLVKKEAV